MHTLAPAQPMLPALQLARTPRLTRRVAWGLLVVLILLVPALGFAPWTQTAHGTGRAIAFNPVQRPQFVISPIEGRVKKWHVVEGDRVKAGQLLVELVDNDPLILERLREQETLALQRLTLAEGRVDDHERRLEFIKGEYYCESQTGLGGVTRYFGDENGRAVKIVNLAGAVETRHYDPVTGGLLQTEQVR